MKTWNYNKNKTKEELKDELYGYAVEVCIDDSTDINVLMKAYDYIKICPPNDWNIPLIHKDDIEFGEDDTCNLIMDDGLMIPVIVKWKYKL